MGTVSFYDTITLSTARASALSIDTLEMNPVPEPGSLLMLGLGLSAAGLALLRRKRTVA